MKVEALTALIEAFLSTRRESSGGWAEVLQGDMEDLQAILDAIIEAKFEKDPDGDVPVEYLLVDRTKYEGMHYGTVPYEHKAKTPEEQEVVFEAVMFNLTIAMQQMNQYLKMRRFHREDAKKKAKKHDPGRTHGDPPNQGQSQT